MLHNLGSGSWLAIASGAAALCGLSTASTNGHWTRGCSQRTHHRPNQPHQAFTLVSFRQVSPLQEHIREFIKSITSYLLKNTPRKLKCNQHTFILVCTATKCTICVNMMTVCNRCSWSSCYSRNLQLSLADKFVFLFKLWLHRFWDIRHASFFDRKWNSSVLHKSLSLNGKTNCDWLCSNLISLHIQQQHNDISHTWPHWAILSIRNICRWQWQVCSALSKTKVPVHTLILTLKLHALSWFSQYLPAASKRCRYVILACTVTKKQCRYEC